ncbi:MAG: histidine kinase dimerization/phospho-acceptor domain-containing protein, partial [Phenylobacterium sp.]|uniref:PAS domain-containing sensor histidine kinase n=1 Tax=Phenylobacterium sp. TaxID=1871053 RepID=UPI0027370B16
MSPLLEALPCAVLITDRELRIAHINPDWESFHERPAASVVGEHLFQIQPTLQQFHAALDKCLKTGEVLKAGPYRTVLQDGSSRLVRSVTLPWTHASGEVGGLVQVVAEMPASQAAQHQLRIEERLSQAAELAGVFVWELDLVTGAAWAAGARDTFFEGAVGAREARVDIWDTVHPDDRAQAMAQWQKSLAEGSRFRAEYRLNRADRLVWVASGAAVTAGTPEQPQRLLGVLQNITERKEAELAAEAGARAKSAFLATVSHEIRTPLNGILGMAQAMEADELGPVQRERLDIIRQSGQALLEILNDVLDLSKVEAGKLELEAIDFRFSDVVDGVCSAFAALAQGKGLSFSVEVEQARGVYRGDPMRLRQVLYNLLANA